MRRMFSVGFAAALALCVAGTASAATSIDLLFAGTGTTQTEVASPSFAGVVILNIFMVTTDNINFASISVEWDNNGLSETNTEWSGEFFPSIGQFFGVFVPGTVTTGEKISSFDGAFAPANTAGIPAGTYQLGTVVFDDVAGWSTTTINAFILTGIDAFGEIGGINITGSVALGSATINVVPEPGTAALLGMGLIGLVLAGRRKHA